MEWNIDDQDQDVETQLISMSIHFHVSLIVYSVELFGEERSRSRSMDINFYTQQVVFDLMK